MVAESRGWTARQFPSLHSIDGYFAEPGTQDGPTGTVKAWVEVKGRNHELAAFPKEYLELAKLVDLERHSRFDPSIPIVVVFAYDDLIGVVSVQRILEHGRPVLWGRTDRGSDERDPCLGFPRSILHRIPWPTGGSS